MPGRGRATILFSRFHILCGLPGKVDFLFMIFLCFSLRTYRVLLATIRNLGKCPCPRCLVGKDELDQVGTVRDDKIRVNSPRVDDERRQSWIELARKWIYRQAKVIKSKSVEAVLYAKSWVPTVVRAPTFLRFVFS